MPRGDGTGPFGRGPRTGRGAGFCGGSANAGFGNGGRRGGGFGCGRGYRNRFFATGLTGSQVEVYPADNDEELAQLKIKAGELARTLREIASRIDAVEKSDIKRS